MLKVLEENKLLADKNYNKQSLLETYSQENQENGADLGANSLI